MPTSEIIGALALLALPFGAALSFDAIDRALARFKAWRQARRIGR